MTITHTNNESESVVLNEYTFKLLFDSSFLSLCTFCQFKFGFNLDLAKEIVHASFVKLWESRDYLQPGQSHKAYLSKIITNKSLDHLKHEKVRLSYASSLSAAIETSDWSYTNAEVKQLAEAINKAVETLPEQMRIVFELSRYHGLSYQEIATKLNISPRTVETQVRRALIKLRTLLSHYLPTLLIGLAVKIFLNYLSRL